MGFSSRKDFEKNKSIDSLVFLGKKRRILRKVGDLISQNLFNIMLSFF